MPDEDDDDDGLLLFASALETGEPDPRQAQFLAAVATMVSEGIQPISMRGFRASAVDLGWIQAEIDDYVATIPGVQLNDLVERIGDELPRVVQRLKAWSVDPAEWPEALRLSFETKDDCGSYMYTLWMSFDVPDDE